MFVLPQNNLPNWDSECAKWLREILESDKGKLLLQLLAIQAPSLLDGSDVNKTLVASGEVKGYNSAISTLVSLIYEQPVESAPPNNYPSLDDDSLWESVDSSKKSVK